MTGVDTRWMDSEMINVLNKGFVYNCVINCTCPIMNITGIFFVGTSQQKVKRMLVKSKVGYYLVSCIYGMLHMTLLISVDTVYH